MTHVLPQSQYTDLNQLAEDLFKKLEGEISLGIPIGIGKATQMVNALYQVAKKNPTYQLSIHTALSLQRPKLKTDLERRLLDPFFDRQFKDVPVIDYAADALAKKLPKNVKVVEFYFKPGEMLKNNVAQQNVLSANYTHVARDMMTRKVNLVTQMVSVQKQDGKTKYSLSANPDVTLDLQRLMREQSARDGKPRLMIAQLNPELPFMPNDAEVTADFFDHIHDDPELYTPLFCTPHQPISPTDHMIGFYTSALIADAGSLQIGIGSLGDAVVNSLLVRHNKNAEYQHVLNKTDALRRFPSIQADGGFTPFEAGLYGNTEMLVPGYLELKKGGVLKRKVFDDLSIQALVNKGLSPSQPSYRWLTSLVDMGRINQELTSADVDYLINWGIFKNDVILKDGQLSINGQLTPSDINNSKTQTLLNEFGFGDHIKHATLMHAGFFVGNHHFYEDLRKMPEDELNEFNMTSVAFTNQLHGQEELKIAQRKHSRFINACMKMTLSGAAVSDGLADGNVVSGVGGQFNFVAMGHDLPGARSIIMMRSCRPRGKQVVSNIVFNYGHVTIPRHMRDIVVTEYGIADLRAKTDEEIIDELLKITDSRFQQTLIRQAQNAGKLPTDYALPEYAKNNTPENIAYLLQDNQEKDFPPFPFGKELTDQEVLIGGALRKLKSKVTHIWPLVPAVLKPVSKSQLERHKENLERLNLYNTKNIKEKVLQKLVLDVLPEPATTAPKQASAEYN
jgi:acyl-CoA hydrolase